MKAVNTQHDARFECGGIEMDETTDFFEMNSEEMRDLIEEMSKDFRHRVKNSESPKEDPVLPALENAIELMWEMRQMKESQERAFRINFMVKSDQVQQALRAALADVA